jgi:hypothetical protein
VPCGTPRCCFRIQCCHLEYSVLCIHGFISVYRRKQSDSSTKRSTFVRGGTIMQIRGSFIAVFLYDLFYICFCLVTNCVWRSRKLMFWSVLTANTDCLTRVIPWGGAATERWLLACNIKFALLYICCLKSQPALKHHRECKLFTTHECGEAEQDVVV